MTTSACLSPRLGALGIRSRAPTIRLVEPEAREGLTRLTLAFQQGDRETFEGIARILRDRIYSLVLRAVRDPGIAEDLSQETLIRAYRRLDSLQDPGSCEGWVCRIAVNLVRDHARKAARERKGLLSLSPREATRPDDGPSPDPALHALILAAVDALPEHHRRVFEMWEMQGMGHAQIARALGVPEGTVWSRLSFARRALQENLRRRMGP